MNNIIHELSAASGRMLVNVFIPGHVPALNQTYRAGNGHFFKASKVKKWQEQAKEIVTLARTHGGLSSQPVSVELTVYYDRRGRDVDGPIKATLDVLQGTIIENDNQVDYLEVVKDYSKESPGVQVCVYERWDVTELTEKILPKKRKKEK